VAKPDPKSSINPVLSQIKLSASKRVEEIIKEKLGKCQHCKNETAFFYSRMI